MASRIHLATVVSASLLVMAPISRAALGDEGSKNCSPEIAKKLDTLKEPWGDFHFTCRRGVVASLEFSTATLLSRDWRKFVRQNAPIFGTTAAELEENNEQDSHYFWQTFKGVRTVGGSIYAVQRNTVDTNGISAHIVDTSKWTVDTVPKISSAAAGRLVMASWDGALGRGVASIDEMWLEVGIQDGKQILFWTVLGAAPGSDLGPNLSKGPTRIGCDVNALDGNQLFDCSREVRPKDPALHFISSRQLVLEVKPDKPAYFEGDEIGVEVTLENVSTGTIRAIMPRIFSCAEDSRSTIKIDVHDASKPQEVIGLYCPYMNDVVESGTSAALLDHTVVLHPGQNQSIRALLQKSAGQSNRMSCEFENRDGGRVIRIGNQLPKGRYRIGIRYAPNLDYYWGQWMQSRYGDIWTEKLSAAEFDLVVRPRHN